MTSHHAVLVRTKNTEQFETATFLSTKGYVEYRYASLGIGEVRKLIEEAHRRPAGEDAVQTLVVVTNFITEEAQHALLKVVEEPPASTQFVFVVPTDVTLLPTLLSRLQVEILKRDDGVNEIFAEFLAGRLSNRMKLIEKKGRDHDWILLIKNGLVSYTGENRSKLSSAQLVSLEYVARHLLTRGASNKFLLEHAALVLPT